MLKELKEEIKKILENLKKEGVILSEEYENFLKKIESATTEEELDTVRLELIFWLDGKTNDLATKVLENVSRYWEELHNLVTLVNDEEVKSIAADFDERIGRVLAEFNTEMEKISADEGARKIEE